MEYAQDRFMAEVREVLATRGGLAPSSIDLVSPPAHVNADLTLPTFSLAATMRINPVECATRLRDLIVSAPPPLVGRVEATGPYLNFQVAPVGYTWAVLDDVARLGDSYGDDATIGAGRTAVVDYSSPNVAKRMHVGHIRSTIIGHAIVRILAALGWHTVGINHLGDWGKSFGVLCAAIEEAGFPSDDEDVLAQLEALYAGYASRMVENAALDEAARSWSLRLEHADPVAVDVRERVIALTCAANRANYESLGVRFDHEFGESHYQPLFDEVTQDALDAGIARADEDGAVVVDLGDGMPTFLLRRTDGGTLYHTRDLAAIKYRVGRFGPAAIVYVVGEPQILHFRQLFELARRLGYVPDTELTHVPFGTISDADGHALSTRRGNMVYLDSLLRDATARARTVIDGRSDALPIAERARMAHAVGVGAVVYNDLFQPPGRNIALDWDRMLATEGNSGPYAQYMHARCHSILRRARDLDDVDTTCGDDTRVLTHPSELALVTQIARLPEAVRHAGRTHEPFRITDWVFACAQATAAFYRDCPVLTATTLPERLARLELLRATATALRKGLHLVGLEAPERM